MERGLPGTCGHRALTSSKCVPARRSRTDRFVILASAVGGGRHEPGSLKQLVFARRQAGI
jgi:hypothetical protein